MTPPINIDGTDISGATIDGQDVSEITVDGDTVFTAIPESAIAYFDATSAFDAGDDGTSISTWQDELGNFNLSGGSPTVRSNGINGTIAVEADGGDKLNNTSVSESQPNTVFAVVEPLSINDGFLFDGGTDNEHTLKFIGEDVAIEAGSSLRGNASRTFTTPKVITVEFNGNNSRLRFNGNDKLTGDAGTDSLTGFTLFGNSTGGNKDVLIGELVLCNTLLSSTKVKNEEQRLADKWGITI